MSWFRSLIAQRSIQVILAIAIYFCLAPFLPLKVHQGLYTMSLLIKDILLWFLPITVSLFIAHAISSFEKKAPFFVIFLFLFEAISNSMSLFYSFGCAHLAATDMHSFLPTNLSDTFDPLWRLSLKKPSWWAADKGSFVGILIGLICAFKMVRLKAFVTKGKEVVETILTKGFARLIPLFILGFIAKIDQTNLMQQMIFQYADFVFWLIFTLVSYIFILFFVGSDFSLNRCLKSIKNLLPATGMAFSSGCSLSTMPWTIEGSSKNLDDPDLAKAVIPATTNIQQIGDCIANSFLCFLIYFHFNGVMPSLSVWLPFAFVFVMARFATAAVLGGAIFIMLPIYETYLGFNAEMIAIILAFNVILDPIITSSNVIANGALCRIFERSWSFFLKRSFKKV